MSTASIDADDDFADDDVVHFGTLEPSACRRRLSRGAHHRHRRGLGRDDDGKQGQHWYKRQEEQQQQQQQQKYTEKHCAGRRAHLDAGYGGDQVDDDFDGDDLSFSMIVDGSPGAATTITTTTTGCNAPLFLTATTATGKRRTPRSVALVVKSGGGGGKADGLTASSASSSSSASAVTTTTQSGCSDGRSRDGRVQSSNGTSPTSSLSSSSDDGGGDDVRTPPTSVSMTSAELLKGVRPRRVQVWTPDDAVTECFHCHVAFGWLTRRHHCRACGHIFCYQCCARHTRLARDIVRYPEPIEGESPTAVAVGVAAPDAASSAAATATTTTTRTASSAPRSIVGAATTATTATTTTTTTMPSTPHAAHAGDSGYARADDAKKERVCDACYKEIKALRPVCDLVREYDRAGHDVVHLVSVVAAQSDAAREAVLLSLSTFREIQYRLPSQPLTARERAMLERNAHLLRGHGAWAVPLAQCGCEVDLGARAVSCRTMMCTRYCAPTLSDYDALYILGHEPYADEALLAACVSAVRDVRAMWLPHLTFALRTHPRIVMPLLVARDDERASVFWLLRMWLSQAKHEQRPATVTIYERALQKFSCHRALQDGARCVQLMMCDDRHGVRALVDEGRNARGGGASGGGGADAAAAANFVIPVLPCARRCVDIDTQSCEVKHSATRPTTYPCRLDDGTTMKVLVKREDIRCDLVMMGAVRYMVDVLTREEGLDLGVVTYNVMPTAIDGGLIEIVAGASTLYDVQHRLCTSVFKHIVESNDHEPARDVRARFVRSTAAYCVMTYLLGVGDRHLENIMVTRDGRLFHIDYGFVLGADPKPMAAPVMRISPGMVEAIGAVGSQQYLEFEALCTRIYNALRRHVRPIAMMLSLLVDMGVTTRATLDAHVMRRFVPGENTVQAQLQLSKRIEGSRTSLTQSAIDISHHQAHVVTQASGYVARPLRRAFTSFESWWWSGGGAGDLNSPGTSPP